MEHKTTRRTPTQKAKDEAAHYLRVAMNAIGRYKSLAFRLDMEAREYDCTWPKAISEEIKQGAKELQKELHKSV